MIAQGCAIAFLQSSLYGIAGVSVKLTNKLMVGIGLGGVTMNVLRIICMVTLDSNDASAKVFFSIASGYLLLCGILAVIFVRGESKAMRLASNSDSFLNLNMSEIHKSRNDSLGPFKKVKSK